MRYTNGFCYFCRRFASIRSMCACVRLPHASFPSLCSSFGHNFGLVLGKFDFFWLFRGVLTRSDVSVGFCESFTTLRTCVHMSNTSVWLSRGHSGLSTYNFVHLAGKFGLADMFAGIVKLFVMLCMRACVRVRRVRWAFKHFWLAYTWFCASGR